MVAAMATLASDGGYDTTTNQSWRYWFYSRTSKKDRHQLPKDHELVVLNLLLSAGSATIAGPEKRTLLKGKRHIFNFNKKDNDTLKDTEFDKHINAAFSSASETI